MSREGQEEFDRIMGKRTSVIDASGNLIYDIGDKFETVTRASLGMTAPSTGVRSKRGGE